MTSTAGGPVPPGPGAGPLLLDGVALVGRTAAGPTVIDGLSLVLDDQGVVIVGPEPGSERRIAWSTVTAATCGAPGTTPGGRMATPLDLTSADRTVRFLLYGDRVDPAQVAQLAHHLPGWTGAIPVPPAPVVAPVAPPPPTQAAPTGLPGFGPPAAPGPYGPAPFGPPGPYGPAPFGPPGGPLPAPGPYGPAPYGPAPYGPAPYGGAPYGPPPGAPYGPPPGAPYGPPPGAPYGAAPHPGGPYPPPYPGGPLPGPYGYGPPPHLYGPPPARPRPWYRRAWVLVAAAVLVVAGTVGLVVGLTSGGSHPSTAAGAQTLSPDQHLANQLVLSQSDLPGGWKVDSGGNDGGNSSSDQSAEQQIEQNFAQCMGFTPAQAAGALSDHQANQTAQAASPLFNGPGPATTPASELEAQSEAYVFKTSGDQSQDFSIVNDPAFPQCNANQIAATFQQGVNDASGDSGTAGPATATVVPLSAPAGEKVFGVSNTFTLSDGGTAITIEADELVVGTDRVEGQLLAVGIDTSFPTETLGPLVTAVEQRLATEGAKSST